MLSLAQVRIALLQLYYSNKPIYNISFDISVNGLIDINLFNKSINYLLIRYPELKTNIFLKNDNLYKKYNSSNFLTEIYLGSDVDIIQYNFINTTFDLSKDLLIKLETFN